MHHNKWGGDRVVAASPSLLGVVLPGSVASMAATAAMVLAAIPVVMTDASSVVSLVVPPPPAMVEEEETEPPASPGEGLQGSPSRSELKAPSGDATEME